MLRSFRAGLADDSSLRTSTACKPRMYASKMGAYIKFLTHMVPFLVNNPKRPAAVRNGLSSFLHQTAGLCITPSKRTADVHAAVCRAAFGLSGCPPLLANRRGTRPIRTPSASASQARPHPKRLKESPCELASPLFTVGVLDLAHIGNSRDQNLPHNLRLHQRHGLFKGEADAAKGLLGLLFAAAQKGDFLAGEILSRDAQSLR